MSFQVMTNGISTGTVYALIAIGFALVFNILKFSNFSYGATMTASAFIAYFLVASKGVGLVPSLICSALAGAVISVIGEFIGFRTLLKNHSPSTYFFVSSITLGTLYEGIVTLKTGTNFYVYPNFFKEASINILNAVVSKENILMLVISAGALVALALVIQKTRIGRAIRAVSFDRNTSELMGINATLIIQIVFVISGIFGGLAGCFLGIKYTLTSTLGSLVVKGFIASVIGGLGSLTGAVIGAMLLGIMEAVFLSTIGSGWATIASFAVMLVFLLIRPQGIAGSNIQEKA
ncbi:branched-chain amino acid ABC transporter permease [Treponema parvum]|uniref:Branched-chain amino acid ABC transporter permease n=1 Tax=Treponema parvum TaxID=138851 RepID=A0A975IDT4_9SPIR|nr:branched-chain amino acid ABC transporter permease [Treponema parvum]QTQ13152.1 branched-chain amino acid ABC transporter permease [Treponema parvum]